MKYCFDMDETICLTPSSRDYSKAIPITKMVDSINNLYNDNEITIFTSRGGTSGVDYRFLCLKQLNKWGVKYHKFLVGKPSFDVFIDDKAINVREWRKQQDIKLTGFLASSFDLLHAGHCLILKEARERCDYMIAALQIDPTIDRSQKNKPVQTLRERRIQLEACRYVDQVVLYNTEEELELILKQIVPDIRFLGSDNTGPITGHQYCKTIYYHDRSHNYSSSELRQRICSTK